MREPLNEVEQRELMGYYDRAYGKDRSKNGIGNYTSDVLSGMYPREVLEWMRYHYKESR